MTWIHVAQTLGIYISTHILTKRMTCFRQLPSTYFLYFNSHPHEEDDTKSDAKFDIEDISTHILTKRMTILQNTDQFV